jgi:hypothetical protein
MQALLWESLLWVPALDHEPVLVLIKDEGYDATRYQFRLAAKRVRRRSITGVLVKCDGLWFHIDAGPRSMPRSGMVTQASMARLTCARRLLAPPPPEAGAAWDVGAVARRSLLIMFSKYNDASKMTYPLA